MDAYLEIIREDGTLERQEIEGAQVTIGRSPTAGIPILDASFLEPEHLQITPRSNGCWVAIAQGARTPARVGSQAFQHGMLNWGSTLEIGNIKLRVTDRLPKEKKGSGEKQVSAPVMIAMFVLIPTAGLLLLNEPSATIDVTTNATPPALFDQDIPCPSTGSTQHRADQDAEAAIARSERYPFDPQDGVDAVHLFREAAACYTSLGASAQATAMSREGQSMADRIEEDYQTHQLRLRRSLEQSRLPDALLETRALLDLVRHRTDDPYVQWLSNLSRQLQIAINTTA